MPKLYEDPALREHVDVFRDREHAGELLAELLLQTGEVVTRLLAIPAGGVLVALPVAERLALPLDVAVTSKITLPWNTESGYGAVSFDGAVLLNDALLIELPLTREQIDEGIVRTREKVVRRAQRFRGTSEPLALVNEAVLLVDDGLASGITMRAAVQACRTSGARRIGVAVPTAHVAAVHSLHGLVDFVACLNIRTRTPFAVADAYERWIDVLELQARDLLDAQRERTTHRDSTAR
jgi:predicted phosphoribosyltransferase